MSDPNTDRLLRHMAWANQALIARLAEQPDAKTVWAQLPLEVAPTAATAEPLIQHPPPPDRPDHRSNR